MLINVIKYNISECLSEGQNLVFLDWRSRGSFHFSIWHLWYVSYELSLFCKSQLDHLTFGHQFDILLFSCVKLVMWGDMFKEFQIFNVNRSKIFTVRARDGKSNEVETIIIRRIMSWTFYLMFTLKITSFFKLDNLTKL